MSREFNSEWLRNWQMKTAKQHNADLVGEVDLSRGVSFGKIEADLRTKIGREIDLHNHIIAYCRSVGWQYLHGSMAAETHRTLGEPDFIILADGGRVLFVECKTTVGKLSPAQRDFAAHAARNGHTVHIVRSMEEFLKLL